MVLLAKKIFKNINVFLRRHPNVVIIAKLKEYSMRKPMVFKVICIIWCVWPAPMYLTLKIKYRKRSLHDVGENEIVLFFQWLGKQISKSTKISFFSNPKLETSRVQFQSQSKSLFFFFFWFLFFFGWTQFKSKFQRNLVPNFQLTTRQCKSTWKILDTISRNSW